MDKSKTFRADPNVMEKVRARKRSEILQTVGYCLILLLLQVFRGDESLYNLAKNFDTKMDTALSWVNFLTFVMFVFVIVSATLAGVYSRQEQRLNASRITLAPNVVYGYSYAPDHSEGEFRIAYSDIISVNATVGSEGVNLVIMSRQGVFQCLAIESSLLVAQEINTRCKNCGVKVADQPQNRDNEANYCPNCGTEIADGALFCHKCGTKVSEKMSFAVNEEGAREAVAVEPKLFGQSMRCPACGAIQRSDRDICWGCGIKFVRKSDTNKM